MVGGNVHYCQHIMHQLTGAPHLPSLGHSVTLGGEVGEVGSRVRGLSHCGILRLRQGRGMRASLQGPGGNMATSGTTGERRVVSLQMAKGGGWKRRQAGLS